MPEQISDNDFPSSTQLYNHFRVAAEDAFKEAWAEAAMGYQDRMHQELRVKPTEDLVEDAFTNVASDLPFVSLTSSMAEDWPRVVCTHDRQLELHRDENDHTGRAIGAPEASTILGVSVQDVQDSVAAVGTALDAARPDGTRSQSALEAFLFDEIRIAPEHQPERVTADWTQTTVMVNAYLEADRPDLVRDWIATLDENLSDFAEGGTPPGSDELASVYHDAVAREAIPYGQAPITAAEVRQELANIGIDVAPLDVDQIRERTGINPVNAGVLTRALDAEPSLPEGLQDAAAARLSVRQALADIGQDGTAARDHLRAADQALTHLVGTLRPDQQPDVAAAQASVQEASQSVEKVTETAQKAAEDFEVTLYTNDNCQGCAATKRALDKAGVEYEEINLGERPDLVAAFKRQGLGQAPIVETRDGERWAGYNPSKLREHGLDYRSRQNRDPGRGPDTGAER